MDLLQEKTPALMKSLKTGIAAYGVEVTIRYNDVTSDESSESDTVKED